MNLKYRPEIDGLRAIAVISVILYHADISLPDKFDIAAGGYFGVDVFFVISGYLITSIIYSEIVNTRRFSLINFYERRIRRILPALIFVSLVFLPVSYRFLLPDELMEFSRSVIHSMIFTSNFYWDSVLFNYDAEPALYQPFLHTWSLAVEEQFYILFPLLLIFIYKRLNEYIFHIFVLLFFSSLLYANVMTGVDQSFSFYMLPTRFWELLSGSFIAIYSARFPFQNRPELTNILPAIGLLLIVISCLAFDNEINHPGLITLLPVAGTVLIIVYSNNQDLASKFLSSKLMAGIGLISYSLYLWHYPIFSFARITNEKISILEISLLIVLTFILSIFSYFYIEKPFRKKSGFTRKQVFYTAGFSIVLIISISAYFISNQGLNKRYPEIIRNINPELLDQRACKSQDNCVFNQDQNRDIFLIGDSQMFALEPPLLDYATNHGYRLTVLNRGGCPYLRGMQRVHTNPGIDTRCHIDTQETRRKILLSATDAITIVGSRLPLFLSEEYYNNQLGGNESAVRNMNSYMQNEDKSLNTKSKRISAFQSEYKSSLLELANHGHKVILIYPIPETGWHIPKKLIELGRGKDKNAFLSALIKEPLTTSFDVYKKRTLKSFQLLDAIKHKNIYRVYPHKLFCNTAYENECSTHNDKFSYYRDYNHLSNSGGKMLVDKIINNPPFKQNVRIHE